MKRSVYLKFIGTYLALALVLIITVFTLGSLLVERELIKERAKSLHDLSEEIASAAAGGLSTANGDLSPLRMSLRYVAEAENAMIRVISPSGEVLLATDFPVTPEEPVIIDGFNAAAFGPGYYEVSDFFGFSDEQCLNVLSPVTRGMGVRGYVAIHLPLTEIFRNRDRIEIIMLIIAGIFIALSFVILLQFTFSVYRPLMKITSGAQEFARGNLHYRITLKSSDEIGFLADSMNAMAQELEKGNEYQRQFVANISHDFRSPLTSIKGFTEAMIDGTIPPEMHEKYLRIINQEADRLEGLTQSVLQMSSMDVDQAVLKRTDFDINRVIKETAALFEGSCRKKKILIRLVLVGDRLFVNADEEKIKQVLYNLLDNAIKFSERDSEIKIETEEKYERCYISVKDYGCGIKTSDLTKIWNRFYKSDSSRGKDRRGSGIGLAIVKEIINAHGQNINVSSTEGAGTEFTFTLALAETEEAS